MPHIYVDADACPVKQEVYLVACRYGLQVTLVANAWMRVPDDDWIALEIVPDRMDAADDRIATRAGKNDIVITADIPLASRCLERGARVIAPTGKSFTEISIGEALATRELLADLRSAGEVTGGPPPLTERDRSHFLQELDRVVHATRRDG